MKKVLIFICVCLCLSCKKDTPAPCKFCDFKPYTRTFSIKGQLFDHCSGLPVANKKMQGFSLAKSDTSGSQTVITGQNGQFDINYSILYTDPISIPPSAGTPFGIRIADDSLLFLIPPAKNFTNLILNLRDSIKCTINTIVAPNSRVFTNSDTLVYYFEGTPNSPTLGINTKSFKKAGPFTKNSIGVVNSPLKIININDDGQYNVVFVWDIITATGYSNSSADKALSSKIPCVMRNDSVLLTLSRN
jgi:hypothetical protein